MVDAAVPTSACRWFVHDASKAGDRFTTAPGDDLAEGVAAAPFARVGHALGVAGPGDVVCVDAGTFDGDVRVTRAVVLRGVGVGESGCSRSGVEAVSRGQVVVTSTAGDVTAEGFRRERPPTGSWTRVNLVFSAPRFRLRDTVVIPSLPDGGFSHLGYVAATLDTAFSAIESRRIAVAPSQNLVGASSAAVLPSSGSASAPPPAAAPSVVDPAPPPPGAPPPPASLAESLLARRRGRKR